MTKITEKQILQILLLFKFYKRFYLKKLKDIGNNFVVCFVLLCNTATYFERRSQILRKCLRRGCDE
jgi:hypothetical protein